MRPEAVQFMLQAAAVLGVLLTAVGSFITVLLTLRNGRTSHAIALQQEHNTHVIRQIKVEVNGRIAELLRVSIALARAEGAAQGRGEALTAAGALAATAISGAIAAATTSDATETSAVK